MDVFAHGRGLRGSAVPRLDRTLVLILYLQDLNQTRSLASVVAIHSPTLFK